MTQETYTMPPNAAPANHGHTAASWALTLIVLAGFVIGAIGLAAGKTPVLIAGGVTIVLGVIVGAVLRGLGHGQPVREKPHREWYS